MFTRPASHSRLTASSPARPTMQTVGLLPTNCPPAMDSPALQAAYSQSIFAYVDVSPAGRPAKWGERSAQLAARGPDIAAALRNTPSSPLHARSPPVLDFCMCRP